MMWWVESVTSPLSSLDNGGHVYSGVPGKVIFRSKVVPFIHGASCRVSGLCLLLRDGLPVGQGTRHETRR